ncbi:MAG TPA: PQQ-dependent sugar dehydrogenase [Thermoleophilaceae bacterium]|nr:PQQ-dependent sugar dehydrogenase [Thermoleophilaceae bacterium]
MRIRAVTLPALAVALCLGLTPGTAQASLSGTPVEVASGLETPWDVLRLPDGRTLVTEIGGRVRVIGADGALRAAPVYADSTAKKFLGMAADPGYATNRHVYLYVGYGSGANPNASRIIRLTDDGTNLVSPVTIFNGGIASDDNHDGGRIAFGPDCMLYATTGDIHQPSLPQNLDSLNGKILRMTATGAAPADNPFPGAGARGFVWSYGHRHPQGIAWDAEGRMWESEHGPSGEGHAPDGAKTGNDEINRIDKGANYGWPVIAGGQTAPGMRTPVTHASNSPAWAPGGLAIGPDRVMYAPFLAGTELRAFTIAGDSITSQTTLYDNTFGRLRAATADATHLWLTTHNRTNNEKVLRVPFEPAGISAPAAKCTAAAPAAPTPARPAARLTRAQLRAIVRGVLGRQAKALRSKRARKLAKVSKLRLTDRALPAGKLSIMVERPAIRRKRARVKVLDGKATTRAGRRAAVTTKLGRQSRKLLRAAARRRGRLKLTLHVGLRTADKRLTTGKRTITILRR